MIKNNRSDCFCGTRISYAECCEPFHLATKLPLTAEQLMRSRYSAFCLKLSDYLVETHQPAKRPARLKQSLVTSFTDTHWTKLEIIETRKGKAKDKHGWVEFKAYFVTKAMPGNTHERSRFLNEKGRWYYLHGQQL